jgi:hypothetical protein
VTERHKDVTDIAQQREGQAAKHRERNSAGEPDEAQIGKIIFGDQRKERQTRPSETVQRYDKWRQA